MGIASSCMTAPPCSGCLPEGLYGRRTPLPPSIRLSPWGVRIAGRFLASAVLRSGRALRGYWRGLAAHHDRAAVDEIGTASAEISLIASSDEIERAARTVWVSYWRTQKASAREREDPDVPSSVYSQALSRATDARDRFLALARKELGIKGRSAGFRDLEGLAPERSYRARRRHPRAAEVTSLTHLLTEPRTARSGRPLPHPWKHRWRLSLRPLGASGRVLQAGVAWGSTSCMGVPSEKGECANGHAATLFFFKVLKVVRVCRTPRGGPSSRLTSHASKC
jgi:hypothetical protein